MRNRHAPSPRPGSPTRYPAATSSVTPVDNRPLTSTAARPRSRRGRRRYSRKTRLGASPSTWRGCRSCLGSVLGRRMLDDLPGRGHRIVIGSWVTRPSTSLFQRAIAYRRRFRLSEARGTHPAADGHCSLNSPIDRRDSISGRAAQESSAFERRSDGSARCGTILHR
jgi:hypothetical protein